LSDKDISNQNRDLPTTCPHRKAKIKRPLIVLPLIVAYWVIRESMCPSWS
jgi:hypothetical protein